MADLKLVYKDTEALAVVALSKFEETWGKIYPRL